MRTLSDALTAAQKKGGNVLCRIVLTKYDDTEYTYGLNTTNRILHIGHPEQEWSQTAQVLIDNRDGNLTALTLEGCLAVISNGYHTTSDEYSATAPLEVISSRTTSLQGELVTTLSLAGVFDMMAKDEASEAYYPPDTNLDTVETILTDIAGAGPAYFHHCKSHTIVFETIAAGYDTDYDDDTQIDTFIPADYFSVSFGESRLSAFRKALAFCKCKARVRNDSGVATIHVYKPVISGTTYDYEYDDAYGLTYHNFFDKSVRKRLVIPNKVIVSSHPDHKKPQYTGNATETSGTTYTVLGDRYIIERHYIRATGDTQCTNLAKAYMQNYELDAEKGHGIALMNVGQEVMDYVNITDSRTSDSIAGNISYLNRWYSFYSREPTRFGFEFRFGKLAPGEIGRPAFAGAGAAGVTYDDLNAALDQVYSDMSERRVELAKWVLDLERWEVTPKLYVTRQMRIPTPNYTSE